jgi:hypothetical protein
VWQEARTLRDAGYQVSVICPKQGEFRASHEILEGIEIYRYPLPEGSGLLSYIFEYLWAFVAQLGLALRIYGRTRFRVIQACNPPDTIFLVAALFKPLGVRFIFDHHDLNPELYLVKFKRRDFLYRLVCLAERLTYRTAKGLDGIVTFAGVRVGKELAAYLSTADVGVAPDPKNPMNDKSTMNKILEYMAFGKPVVLFDLTEGRRAAADAALYATPDDPTDLAAKITELLDSEPLRRRLGECGRRRIEEFLNWDHDKIQLLAAYRMALGEPQGDVEPKMQ